MIDTKKTIRQGKSLCAFFAKWDQCHTVVKRGRLRPDLHHCRQTKCSTCSKYFDTKYHLCYRQPVKERPVDETQQAAKCRSLNERRRMSSRKRYSQTQFMRSSLRGRRRVFFFRETIPEMTFANGCLQKNMIVNCIVMAHNFQGYDGCFIQRY